MVFLRLVSSHRQCPGGHIICVCVSFRTYGGDETIPKDRWADVKLFNVNEILEIHFLSQLETFIITKRV